MNSVRFRLLILALAPMVVLMPLLLFLGMTRWTADYDEVLIANVESDLRIAEQYLSRLMVETGDQLQAVAGSVEFAQTPPGGFAAFFADKRAALGITVPDLDPPPVPPPEAAPQLDIVEVVGRTVKVRLRNAATGKRKKPEGVATATVLSYVG